LVVQALRSEESAFVYLEDLRVAIHLGAAPEEGLVKFAFGRNVTPACAVGIRAPSAEGTHRALPVGREANRTRVTELGEVV
jgi:hypothetical protein